MLHRLVELPFRYFCEPRCRQVLLPILLCAVLHEPANLRILSSCLSPEHLVTFLKTQSLAVGTTNQAGATQAAGATQVAGATQAAVGTPPPLAPAVLADDPSELPMVSLEYGLAARVPPALWPACMRYLSERPESPMPGLIDGVEPPPSAVMSEGTAAAALEVEKAGATTGKKFTSQAALVTPPPAPPPPPPPPPPFEPPERAAAPAVPPILGLARSKWGDSDEEPETTPVPTTPTWRREAEPLLSAFPAHSRRACPQRSPQNRLHLRRHASSSRLLSRRAASSSLRSKILSLGKDAEPMRLNGMQGMQNIHVQNIHGAGLRAGGGVSSGWDREITD